MAHSRETTKIVKERADIVQVIGEKVALTPAGANFKGLCPFHSEKTPSFHVNPAKGIYHCFGCGAGGSVIDFLMAYERLSFPDAVAALAERFGIPLGQGGAPSVRHRHLELLQAARGYYQENLLRRPAGEAARRYLRERSFEEDSWQAFSLGFALDDWRGFTGHAQGKGFAVDDLIGCGLVKAAPSGRPYDLMRNRVVFPILDPQGACIAFGGRVIRPQDAPKYLNTPETRHYRKSAVLFGLANAREAIRTAGRAILVEGYLDVMRLHERGLREAVATCGTALTSEHLELLERYTRRVLLVFDGDEAGMKAALRSAPLFLNRGIEARVVTLPGGLDPDDFLLRQGAEAFAEQAERATPILEHLVFQTLHRHGNDLAGRERALAELVPLISEIRRPATRDLTLRHLADLLLIKPETIQALLRPAGGIAATKGGSPAPMAEPAAGPGREGRHQRMVMKILLQERSLLPLARKLVAPEDLSDGRLRRLYERMTGLPEERYAALELDELMVLFPEQAPDLRALTLEAPLHARGVENWERVLRGEAARIKEERRLRLLHRLRHAPQGTPEEEQAVNDLIAFRREMEAWKPQRQVLGAAAPRPAARPAPKLPPPA